MAGRYGSYLRTRGETSTFNTSATGLSALVTAAFVEALQIDVSLPLVLFSACRGEITDPECSHLQERKHFDAAQLNLITFDQISAV